MSETDLPRLSDSCPRTDRGSLRFGRHVHRLSRRASKLADELDDVAAGILVEGQPIGVESGHNSGNGDRKDRVLLREAARGIERLKLQWQPNGRLEVRIESGEPFDLSPRLGQLLEALLSGDEWAPDGFVSWKSKDDVRKMMWRISGKRNKPKTLDTQVYRLCGALLDAGENPYLVQRNDAYGIRFALRLSTTTAN